MRGIETNPAKPMQQAKHHQVHQHANPPNGGKGKETQRHNTTKRLIRKQPRKFQQHRRIQLAFARHTRAEGIRNFQAAQGPFR